MAGLVKAKKYDWKDSNLALFGSDTEKQVKKESAESEPAWQGAGVDVGLKIWRIVKFQVTEWPEDDYGKFYDGDSYIILNTYKEEDELKYDVHFWIGKGSTQDEYGTAAYKTVELDTFLDDKPIQHREVQNHESTLFKSYFNTIQVLKGGAETGFRHVQPESYKPRLLHFSGKGQNVAVKEVSLSKSNINTEDAFILDLGLELFQYNASDCSKDEKFKAAQYVQSIKSERSGKPKLTTIDGESSPEAHKFYEYLNEEAEEEAETDYSPMKKLFRVAGDDGGSVELVKEDDMSADDLVEDDVFLLDSGNHVFIWVGKGASPAEKKNGIPYAVKYLNGTDHAFAAITVVNSGRESEDFCTAMAA